MQVSTEISRSDLIWMNLYLLKDFRMILRVTLPIPIVVGFFFLLEFIFSRELPDIGATLAGFAPLMLIAPVLILAMPLLVASKANGILGLRRYNFDDQGMYQYTKISEVLVKWPQIRSLRKTRRFLLAEISPNCFWIIPNRAFQTPLNADAFYTKAVAFWKSAHPGS